MANVVESLLRKIDKDIERETIRIIKTDVPKLISDILRSEIDNQVDAEGKKFPTKKPATKIAYEKKGLDKNHWLVASGKATNYPSLKLKKEKLTNGIKLNPRDPNNILQYVEQADSWFMISDKAQEEIMEYIQDKIADFLKRNY
jgi:hypothetical protein